MAQNTELHPTDQEPITLADHGYFFVKVSPIQW
jgi:hypothetical protein